MSFRAISSLSVLGLLFASSFPTIATTAFLGKDVPQQNGSVARGYVGGAIQMRSETQGVDFNSYLHDVYLSIKKHWFANMPPSVEKGQQGTNSFEFQVLQDGTIPKDSLKIVLSSGKSDFDAASLQGIREAVPFSHLPEKFAQPFIVLRFTFYYNLPIPTS